VRLDHAAAAGAPLVLGGHSQGGGFAQAIARHDRALAPAARLDLRGLLLLDPVPLGGAGCIFWRFAKTFAAGAAWCRTSSRPMSMTMRSNISPGRSMPRRACRSGPSSPTSWAGTFPTPPILSIFQP
jgi:pimeloyl-ACP methyl ester carboxylesterase